MIEQLMSLCQPCCVQAVPLDPQQDSNHIREVSGSTAGVTLSLARVTLRLVWVRLSLVWDLAAQEDIQQQRVLGHRSLASLRSEEIRSYFCFKCCHHL